MAFVAFKEREERGTEEESAESAMPIISCIILSGQKYTQMT